LGIDDLGRVLHARRWGDKNRQDVDGVCIDVVYAQPVGKDARTFTAVQSRTVTDCAGKTLASEAYQYDGTEKVDIGFVTTATVNRFDDQGGSDGAAAVTKLTPDLLGNPQ